MYRRLPGIAASCVVAFALGACGASHTVGAPTTSVVPNVVPSRASAAMPTTVVPVHLSFALDPDAARGSAAHLRRRQFISPSNTLLSVTVTPFGGSSTVYGPSACTSGTCTAAFSATPGPNTIVFTFTDGASNVLSKVSTTVIVQPSNLTTLKFSANPVVSSLAISLAAPNVNAGAAVDDLLVVNALDADGNTITGTHSYVDGAGNPLALLLQVSNAQAGGRGRVNLTGPTRITGAGQAAIYAHYDGNWLNSATISASASGSSAISPASTTLTTIPQTFEYGLSGTPYGIVAGFDGNLWVTQFGGNAITKMSTTGAVLATYPCTGCGQPGYLASGPDGNYWFAEQASSFVGKMTPQGVVSRYDAGVANPVGVTAGGDGNMWFIAQHSGRIIKVTSAGVPTYYNGPGGPENTRHHLRTRRKSLVHEFVG